MTAKAILILDDDLDTRVIYRAILARAGYAVIDAEDGAMGLRLALERRPDLILMDVYLPELDGWGFMERLRADGRVSSIPVCAITARIVSADDRARADAAGFVCYLIKPAGPLQVLGVVERWIGRPDGVRAGDHPGGISGPGHSASAAERSSRSTSMRISSDGQGLTR